MKKVLSIVLSIAMVVCLAPTMAFAGTTTAASNAAYSDIEGTACEGAVNVLSALGVVDGFTDGTYKPEQTVTRAQMAKLVVTALGLADYATATTSKYVDMGTATWAIPYVEYASNLNIVNGVGNGKFNPNGLVTYEQAATMIVRALGYTDACNEMNGSWPAIYVQKAMALGLFNDVTNGGANGANRGDIAIMLYNALTVLEVYADNDGATQKKQGADGTGVTMMETLNVNGSSTHKVVDDTDADSAVNNIAGYIGAAAEVIYNKDGKVLALSDIKTQFLPGEIKSNGKFEADNGTTYTIGSDAFKEYAVVNGVTNGTVTAAGNGIPSFTNNVKDRTPATELVYNEDGNNNYTLAATVSGKTITGIYSIATWEISQDKKVEDSDLNQITKNKKLLTVKFDLDDDQEIDTASFILNGAASLSDIKADSVVYVYAANSEVKRVDVGTETVTGTITKTTDSKVTIDGKAYKISDRSGLTAGSGDLKAGNEVTLILDYDGKIYDADLVDGKSGNFAVVVSTSSAPPSSAATASAAKVELLTADGTKVFTVNGKKYTDNEDSIVWTTDKNGPAIGQIVKYTVNENGEVTKLASVEADEDYDVTKDAESEKVTKAGYLAGYGVSETALIFAVPTTDDKAFDYSDSDEFNIAKKADVVDTDLSLVTYVVEKDTNKIVCMIMDDSSTSDDTYGIVTSTYAIDGGDGVDFYVGTEKVTDAEVEGTVPTTVKKDGALYKIKKTTSGSYKFESVDTVEDGTAVAAADTVKNDYVQLTEDGKKFNISGGVVVYIYDASDDEYNIGSKSDLTDDEVTSIKLYQTAESSDDDYGLVNYIVITMK